MWWEDLPDITADIQCKCEVDDVSGAHCAWLGYNSIVQDLARLPSRY